MIYIVAGAIMVPLSLLYSWSFIAHDTSDGKDLWSEGSVFCCLGGEDHSYEALMTKAIYRLLCSSLQLNP